MSNLNRAIIKFLASDTTDLDSTEQANLLTNLQSKYPNITQDYLNSAGRWHIYSLATLCNWYFVKNDLNIPLLNHVIII